MPDRLTIEQRHNNMAAIHAKDTRPEMIVRSYLWNQGFRYRLNHPRLPGKPDIVLRRYRTCIFVNGCFWHGHGIAIDEVLPSAYDGDRVAEGRRWQEDAEGVRLHELQSSACCKIPKTNREFWVRKIVRNRERDLEVQHQLARMGWHCITIWECQLRPACRQETLEGLVYTLSRIFLQHRQVRSFAFPDEEETAMMAAEDSVGYLLPDEEETGMMAAEDWVGYDRKDGEGHSDSLP